MQGPWVVSAWEESTSDTGERGDISIKDISWLPCSNAVMMDSAI